MDIFNKRWFKVSLWIIIYAIFFNLTHVFQGWEFSLYSSTYNTLALYLVHLVTSKFLLPRFRDDKNLQFFGLVVIATVCMTVCFSFFERFIIDRYRVIDHARPPFFFHAFKNFLLYGFFVFIEISFYLVKRSDEFHHREEKLREEKLNTELKLLKAQINPHFIFNALNNIYSLTYMKSDLAPESVLKLSEMLRYVFYDCSKDKVFLNSEIKYIDNYTSFQQMKSEESQNIVFSKSVGKGNVEIAPMLFIPFVENAFKYSRVEDLTDSKVEISIEEKKGLISFVVVNTVPLDNKPASGSGTGIKNVRHRLDIIYPGRHKLNISDNGNVFSVKLKISI